jgi:hypothetical protein
MSKAFSRYCCGHCTGVFIGTRAAACPLTKTFMPSSTRFIPRIFSRGEVTGSHYGKVITDTAPNALILAGPITMGRIPHGPPVAVTTWETYRLWQSLRLATRPRRGPRRSPSDRRLRHVRWSHRAKGSVFAFAPTLRKLNCSWKSSTAVEEVQLSWKVQLSWRSSTQLKKLNSAEV